MYCISYANNHCEHVVNKNNNNNYSFSRKPSVHRQANLIWNAVELYIESFLAGVTRTKFFFKMNKCQISEQNKRGQNDATVRNSEISRKLLENPEKYCYNTRNLLIVEIWTHSVVPQGWRWLHLSCGVSIFSFSSRDYGFTRSLKIQSRTVCRISGW